MYTYSVYNVIYQIWGFSGSSVGEESTYNARDLGSIPGLGRYLGEGNQYSGLEKPMAFTIHRLQRVRHD